MSKQNNSNDMVPLMALGVLVCCLGIVYMLGQYTDNDAFKPPPPALDMGNLAMRDLMFSGASINLRLWDGVNVIGFCPGGENEARYGLQGVKTGPVLLNDGYALTGDLPESTVLHVEGYGVTAVEGSSPAIPPGSALLYFDTCVEAGLFNEQQERHPCVWIGLNKDGEYLTVRDFFEGSLTLER